MASSFAKDALKICVAQICQNIGWHAVQASPMDILVDVLQRYIFEIAKSVHQYSTQYNRTEPNLDDLALTFKDFGIVLQEIEEYVNNVEPVPFSCKIASFPVKHPSNLQHPKPGSRELLTRPEHIPEYLPLMRPDLEEEETFNQQNSVDGAKKVNSESNAGGDSPSPFNSPKHGARRSADWAPDTPSKKPRYYSEEEGRPMREVTSVFMTAAGFISPIHEGKIAESSLPCLVDSPPPTPEYQSPPHTAASSKEKSKSKDAKKDKSSKSKKDKESKKDVKKLKSKKEKENKENASKHDKAMTSSSSVKKDHNSHKSSKSDKSSKPEDIRQKLKSDKAKLKARKEEYQKMKESLKMIKMKNKMKHTGSSTPLKSPKGSSKKLKSGKVSKPYKNLSPSKQKSEKIKVSQSSPLKAAPPPAPPPPPPPVPIIPKEPPIEVVRPSIIEPVIEEAVMEDIDDDREEVLSFREESPESRLVIDDSLETQARQERESRLEVIDECIEAVIRRGEEESEVETEKTHKAMDDIISSVVRGPSVKKLEPKDIYDFTDTSDESSLSSCDIPPTHSPASVTSSKKEKKTPDSKKSDSPEKNKKEKSKKKREAKAKSPSPYSPPKTHKPQFILKVDDRTPSPPPSLKDDLLSSDGSTPSSSPPHNTFLEHSPTRPGHMHPTSLLSHMSPPMSSSFNPMPGAVSAYSTNPFTPMRPLPSHMQTHFPTPPLFVTPAKTESGGSFQNIQPLNLAKSGPSSLKSSPDKTEVPSKVEGSDLIKKAVNLLDKSKSKDHKKEKVKKRGRKETEKAKEKKEEIKEKEKVKPKEKPKAKPEKVKVDKRKSKPEKKKKEEKTKDDAVPKITMKLSSGTGSAKICFKHNTKNSTLLSSSPSTSDEDEMLPTPSPPPRVHSPSPSPSLSPPRESTPPPPPTPSPPPPPPVKEEKILITPIAPPPPITKSTSSRGRGRGRKAAAPAPVPPPKPSVITETVGTIVDESGNTIWICPACSGADDGSPMIGCDECDDWYHWVCVGIVVPPKEEEEWFCVRCIAKRQAPKSKKGRKRMKKD